MGALLLAVVKLDMLAKESSLRPMRDCRPLLTREVNELMREAEGRDSAEGPEERRRGGATLRMRLFIMKPTLLLEGLRPTCRGRRGAAAGGQW
jgi:hypothetical protein